MFGIHMLYVWLSNYHVNLPVAALSENDQVKYIFVSILSHENEYMDQTVRY